MITDTSFIPNDLILSEDKIIWFFLLKKLCHSKKIRIFAK